MIATVSTPIAAPVIAGTRLRMGKTNSARGASRFVADTLATVRRARAGGGLDDDALVIGRADSAYYNQRLLQP